MCKRSPAGKQGKAAPFPKGAHLAINLTKLPDPMQFSVPDATDVLVNKTAVAKANECCTYKRQSTQSRL